MAAKLRWPVLALAVVACRDKEAPAPASSPAPAAVAAAPQPTAQRPALPAIDAPRGPNLTPEQAFAAEHPDEAWKAATEHRLHARLAKLPGGTPQIDCRETQCLLTVTGSRQDVSRAIDQLQELRDIAQNVVLTRPDEQPDGKLALRAYLVFARD